MKLGLLSASIALCTLIACSSVTPKYTYTEPQPSMRLTLLPHNMLAVGKSVLVEAKLTSLRTLDVVPSDSLDTVETQKIHLYAIDATLTDYQHITPQATNTAGLYQFNFTPKLPGSYRVWADLTPAATHRQEFDIADLGGHPRSNVHNMESLQANIGEYRFTLAFDKKLVEGQDAFGTIHVSDAKGDVKTLQTAFAHVVGFYGDLHTVLHTHTMSAEAKNGSDVSFPLKPVKSGFIKLFAQYKINGRDYIVPFGVMVAVQPTK